jgi:hypothetical protein
MKKILLAFLSIVFIATSASTTIAGAQEDEQWTAPVNFSPTYHGLVIQNAGDELSSFSHLFAIYQWSRGLTQQNFDRYVCTSSNDPSCTNADVYEYNAILPTCQSDSQSDCVDSLSAIDSQGRKSQGTFDQYTFTNQPNSFPAEPSLAIPSSASPGIWTVSGAPHGFGDKYVVKVALSGSAFLKGQDQQTLSASVTPISEMAGGAPAVLPSCWTWLDPNRNHYNNQCHLDLTPQGADYRCAFILADYKAGTPNCLLPHAFPQNINFSLSIRLSREPVSWFHGRLANPVISEEKRQSGIQLNVTAQPVKVPIAFAGGPWSTLTKELTDFWKKCDARHDTLFQCSGAGNFSDPLPNRVGTMLLPPYGGAPLEAITALSKITSDKSVASPSTWNFESLSSNYAANSCFATGTGLKGIVTTNSTAYSEGPPIFDGGSLNYQVASLHFNPDGSVFNGSYNLVLRSDVARCLYDFTQAPIKASISVVSANGANQVATTVSNEKDGWLYLSANGFTFSSPTVKVKLTQDKTSKVAASTASPSPTASQQGNSQITITCIKGKAIKTVSGVKPICPSGYKKK